MTDSELKEVELSDATRISDYTWRELKEFAMHPDFWSVVEMVSIIN